MFSSIRSRLLLIGLLVVASVYFLFPRNGTLRERGVDGIMRDTVVTRVPLKRGLDLRALGTRRAPALQSRRRYPRSRWRSAS